MYDSFLFLNYFNCYSAGVCRLFSQLQLITLTEVNKDISNVPGWVLSPIKAAVWCQVQVRQDKDDNPFSPSFFFFLRLERTPLIPCVSR